MEKGEHKIQRVSHLSIWTRGKKKMFPKGRWQWCCLILYMARDIHSQTGSKVTIN